MSICTVQEVKDRLGITDTSEDAALQKYIDAATKRFEGYTRRKLSTGVATKHYNGNDKGILYVDDFQAITSVELLGPDNLAWKSFNVDTELRYFPYDITPKNKIIIYGGVSENPYRFMGISPFVFPRGFSNIRVTGNFGSYAVPPEDVNDLGINMVTVKRSKARMRGITSSSIGGESVTFSDKDLDNEMLTVMEDYKKTLAEVYP
jgi:hypothetical protein